MVNSFEIMNETENLGLYTPKPPNYHTLKEKLGRDNATIYVARSGSMEPYFYPDDMLLVSNSTAFNDVRIGDVIVFKKPADNSISIIARIIDIQTDSVGQRIITTKGDNNPSPILGTDFRIKKDIYRQSYFRNYPSAKMIILWRIILFISAEKRALLSDWNLKPSCMVLKLVSIANKFYG